MLKRSLLLLAVPALIVLTAAPAWAGDAIAEVGTDGGGAWARAGTVEQTQGTGAGTSGGAGEPSDCITVPMNEYESAQMERIEPHPGHEGTWYLRYRCEDIASFWIPEGQPPVDPVMLARQAYQHLPVPAPEIRTNPPPDRPQLVNVPTWLWVDGDSWGARQETASVPGVQVTVRAVPEKIVWETGDGARVVCEGPGTAYDPSRAAVDQQPSCAHTYRRSSAGQPGGEFTVTATATWRVSWDAEGVPGGGALPALTQTAQTTLRVAEVQAVNR